MSSSLSGQQLSRLNELFIQLMSDAALDIPRPTELEPGFTSRVLRPLIESWVGNLRKPNLLVRGDGSVNSPRALTVGNLVFYPDIEIVAESQRCLAVEVKFIRPNQDPTGSFAKAIGQSILYRELGYASSHAAIVDLRAPDTGPTPTAPKWENLTRSGVHLHWFRASGAVCRVGPRLGGNAV